MNVIELKQSNRVSHPDHLQIVVIDSFYDAATHGNDEGWLSKLFRFKVISFLESYPYGMLSFGAADLIGTHWILCQKEQDELKPIMAFKTIDTARTDAFRMDFPGFEPIKQPGLEQHRAAVSHELHKTRTAGYPLGYVGSWTIHPEVRRLPPLAAICRKATAALLSHWIQIFDVQTAVTYASLRFRVERFHSYLGMTPLTGENGEELPEFKMHGAFDETLRASVLYRRNHSVEAQRDQAELSSLWEKRIVLAPPHSPLSKEMRTVAQAA